MSTRDGLNQTKLKIKMEVVCINVSCGFRMMNRKNRNLVYSTHRQARADDHGCLNMAEQVMVSN